MSEKQEFIELEVGWKVMEEGFKKLQRIIEESREQFTRNEYSTYYTTVYNMCVQKHPYAEELYDRYKNAIDDYLRSTVIPCLRDKRREFLLRELAIRWNNHRLMIKTLRRSYGYLDRYYIPNHQLPTLEEVGVNSFRDLVYEEFKSKVSYAVIVLINRAREGELIDKSLLRTTANIIEMGKGTDGFENKILTNLAQYYTKKSSRWIVELSFSDYVIKVEECLKKEEGWISHFMGSNSRNKVSEKLLHHLLVLRFEDLLMNGNSGFHALLRDGNPDHVNITYKLFEKVPKGLEHLANSFKQHIHAEGMILMKQAEDVMGNKAEKLGAQSLEITTKIIEFHDKYMSHITDSFSNDSQFYNAVHEAFVSFYNKAIGDSSSAEILASFCDGILKKWAAEKLSSGTAEESLNKAVNLLKYVDDKDLFGEFYKKKMSRRLLFDRSFQDDQERYVLSKLKQEFGISFTSKMEQMLTDITLAQENHKPFQRYTRAKMVNLGMDFSVTVIKIGIWPSYNSYDLILPPEMAKCVQLFKEFYEMTTTKRRLTFIYSLGSCNVIGKFESKPIELIVATYQAAVLVLFNNADKMSYAEIKEQLNLDDVDLSRVLHSLSCAKYKILKKEPNTNSISPTDKFEFNSKFTDRMRKIKIPLLPIDERRKTIESVEKDRRYAIEAALVRIMKSRKVMGYQPLIAECVQQLSKMFKPHVKEVKKRIGELITRDYLERDKDDPTKLIYMP